ncbi:hypothetical protein V8E52_006359 [Russula decolorans]
MSQAERTPADVEMGDQTGVYHGWPRSAPIHLSPAESNFGDGSGPLLTIYSKVAEKDDNKRAERWQKDAQGILIFTGLFSIVVAILVTMSVQDLRPRPRDDSAFYLQNIYQLLANPNAYDALNPPPFVITPPAFSPPLHAVWVNSLWFLSLAISLTSALLATLLHQWTRRYLTVTQPVHCSPHKRARIRAFFANGVDKMHLPWVVEALPILLHLSLSLFLAGLLIFLFNINHTAFNAVVGWVALFAGVYACITFMPIFRHDSPFYAPLSSTAWFLYAATLYAVFSVLSFVRSGPEPSSSDLLYAPHPFIRVTTSSRPVSVESQALSITSLDIAAADITEGNADATSSPVTHPIPRSESPDGSTLQRSEELTVVPSPVVSDSAPPPIPSTVISGPNPMDVPSNIESTQPQSEDVPGAPGSPSSFPTAHLQLASGLDSQITESLGTTAAQYDTHDVASSTAIAGFHRPHSLTLANPDISESTPLPEDHERESSES